MGIRFFCPQGHRLHVKSFLAGKRGVCPDCGAAVDIPMESDARAVGSKKKSAKGGGDEEEGAKATAVLERPEAERPEIDISVPAPPQRPAHNDFALPVSLDLPPTAAPTNGVRLPAVSAPVGTAVTGPVTNPPAVPPADDPIAEAPTAIWYVRPPAGGQYGPARGDVMRKWLGEGRVTTDSLVWRDGWSDWRPALKVFPDLGSKYPGSAVDAAPIIADAPRRPIRPARKSSTAQGVGIVITLGVVCVGLFVALLYVLMNNTSVAPTP